MCCQDGHQRAECNATFDDKISTQRVEQEWRQRGQKIVEGLDEELQAEDLPAHVLKLSEACTRWEQPGRIDLTFAQLIAQLPAKLSDFLDPGARKRVDPALQLGQQHELNWQYGQCCGTQDRVLNEHEKQDRQKRTALQDWQRKDICRKATYGLDFLRENRDDFALVLGVWIAAPLPIDQQAEAPQKTLRDIPFEDV